MDLFWKTCAAMLVALILILTLGKQERDMGTLLAIGVCCMGGIAAMQSLKPVLDFLYELETLVNIDGNVISILLRIVGVGLVAELVSMICADAGNTSLGKTVHMLASSVILYLSIPIFQGMVDLIREILGEL